MPDSLIIIRQPSHLRNVSASEVLHPVPDDCLRLPRESVEVDMRPFKANVENGYWDDSESHIAERSRAIRELAADAEDPVILYFGLAEIPHIIALGAYVGDEHQVLVHDYDRDTGSWEWPSTDRTIKVITDGLPSESIEARGEAVLRVSVSYEIRDSDVDAVVPRDRLADIHVRVVAPHPTIIRSQLDATALRHGIRESICTLRELRPGLSQVHLFVAAPASVCFLIGQELRLRSGVPIVTYRFRSGGDDARHSRAILLQSGSEPLNSKPLTVEEQAEADTARQTVWPRAVRQVVHYAHTQLQDSHSNGERWHAPLLFSAELRLPDPFPPLPPVWKVADRRMGVSKDALSGGQQYALPKTGWNWQLSDELLLSQRSAARCNDGAYNEALMNRLVRLFVFHECLHNHHALTKYSATAVGRFANCLERIDYMADLYAVLHELDFSIRNESEVRWESDTACHDELKVILDNALRSHWAFVGEPPVYRWQVRHVRRFLNWYWRLIQVVRATSFDVALRVLSEPPAIEIAGFEHSVGGRRIYLHLDRLDVSTDLSLGLVTEKAQLLRINHSVNADLKALADNLAHRAHEAIKTFFQTVFEAAEQVSGALPLGSTGSRLQSTINP